MTDLVNLAIRKNFFGEEREFKLYVNQPHVLDVFIPAEDKLNILLLIEITSDECNHSRAVRNIIQLLKYNTDKHRYRKAPQNRSNVSFGKIFYHKDTPSF